MWVVDDSPLDAERAAAILRPTYAVETLTDGPTALARLTGGPPPHALVLDWLMPDVSGIEVVRFLRDCDRPDLQELKVLLLTARGNPEQVAEGLEAGADDYLAKPWSPIELQARVAALLRARDLATRARAAERSIRELLAQAPDAIIVLDPSGRVAWSNAEAQRLLGSSTEGIAIGSLLPELDLARLHRPAASADLHIGDRVYAPSVRSVSQEAIAGTVLALRDVTDARCAANRRLDFYSMIAHDLRSPISNMMLRTQLITQGAFGDIDPRIALELQRIEDSGRQLVSLIDDFLEIARFESMSHNLKREVLDLCDIVRPVCSEYAPSVRQRGVQLSVACPDQPVHVVGDDRRLRQVLTNLLTNALKFTPSGGRVHVECGREGDQAWLVVDDTGRGIHPDLMDRLFARYVREETRHAAPGTGLGLVIVREIVEAHGGTVTVESELDRGTRFTVWLPSA